MPFPFVKVKNTNNLCDCEMTMSLGSRNLGYAGITKPSRVCDNSIVHNSAEWQSSQGGGCVGGSSAGKSTKPHQVHLPSHPVSEPLTAKPSFLHSKFEIYIDPEISKSASVFSLSFFLYLFISLFLSPSLFPLTSLLKKQFTTAWCTHSTYLIGIPALWGGCLHVLHAK